MALSPDGHQALTGSLDGRAILWDASTGQQILGLDGNTSAVNCVAFSPDGHHLIVGCTNRTAILWDKWNGRKIRSFGGQASFVKSVAFSLDGRNILIGLGDLIAAYWDLGRGQPVQSFRGHSETVTSAVLSPDGSQILTGSYGSRLQSSGGYWKPARLDDYPPRGCAIGGLRPRWTSCSHGMVRHRDAFGTVSLASNCVPSILKPQSYIRWHSAPTNSFSILTGSGNNTAVLWDVASGNRIQTFNEHKDDVGSVAFSPDGSRVLTGSYD